MSIWHISCFSWHSNLFIPVAILVNYWMNKKQVAWLTSIFIFFLNALQFSRRFPSVRIECSYIYIYLGLLCVSSGSWHGIVERLNVCVCVCLWCVWRINRHLESVCGLWTLAWDLGMRMMMASRERERIHTNSWFEWTRFRLVPFECVCISS